MVIYRMAGGIGDEGIADLSINAVNCQLQWSYLLALAPIRVCAML